MKRTKMIIIISTIAIFGTAGLVYYFYRRNKTLLSQVKKLKRDAWCNDNKISDSDLRSKVQVQGDVSGGQSALRKQANTTMSASNESLNSLRNEINNLEDMLSSSEEDTDSSSDEDVNSEALLKDILDEESYIEINQEQTIKVVNETEPDLNPLRSYHLDENENNDNLELRELMDAATNQNIETLVQENISKAVVNITPQFPEKDYETEDTQAEVSSLNDDTVSSNIIEISNMSSQSSIISDTLTLEVKINILMDKYTKNKLVSLCHQHNVSKSGAKRVLITRLIENNYNFNLNKISDKTQELNKN